MLCFHRMLIQSTEVPKPQIKVHHSKSFLLLRCTRLENRLYNPFWIHSFQYFSILNWEIFRTPAAKMLPCWMEKNQQTKVSNYMIRQFLITLFCALWARLFAVQKNRRSRLQQKYTSHETVRKRIIREWQLTTVTTPSVPN